MLYHEIHGSGDPLLLIAGLGSDSSSWLSVVKELSANFLTIIFDNRGCGRSDVPSNAFTIANMAEDAIQLLESLKIERAHILGHSMGGYIAQEMAIRYPERVNKLVLESTAAISSKRNNELFNGFLKNLQTGNDYAEWIRTWTTWLFSPQTLKNTKFINTFIKSAVEYPYRSTAEGFGGQVRAIAAFDATERVKNIKAETLVLEGEEDRLILPEEASKLARNITGSMFQLCKNTGHCMHIENAKLFVKVIEEFLSPSA